MNFKELKKWIKNELPIDGEWYSDGYEKYIESAVTMLNSGMDIDDIKEILENLYTAVSQEFQ